MLLADRRLRINDLQHAFQLLHRICVFFPREIPWPRLLGRPLIEAILRSGIDLILKRSGLADQFGQGFFIGRAAGQNRADGISSVQSLIR